MTQPNFDETIQRINTHSQKWDGMAAYHGVSPKDGIPMWVADMDFRPPSAVQDAVQAMADHGIYGYFGDDTDYRDSIVWWMMARHQWTVEKDWIFTTAGLVNGTAMCVDAFTKPGDGVILMTPVYHAFARVINSAQRHVVECPLVISDGQYQMDFSSWQSQLTGNEKLLILCSPHNPGGRVWSRDELQELARFCQHNDLILVSDEIHHDLLFQGNQHTIMSMAAPDTLDRIVVMSAATKTFNIAGAHVGNVIIPDPTLRARFDARMKGLAMSPNAFGMHMVTAAYSENGALWLDALMVYLEENRRLFDNCIAEIAGAQSMQLQSTYLAWVDFSARGINDDALTNKIRQEAKIAVNLGPSFGSGGSGYLRFNLATQRSRVIEACDRLTRVFAGG